jgi:hypothetical protein
MMGIRKPLGEHFSDQYDDPTAMMDMFATTTLCVPRFRPVDFSNGNWGGLGPDLRGTQPTVPAEPFPVTNSTDEVRSKVGIPPLG